MGEALLVLPFNLACKQGNERPTAEQMAALLVPLQMHLKYTVTDRWAEVQRLAALSDCPAAIAGEEKPIVMRMNRLCSRSRPPIRCRL